jgi:hypothetical protein
MCALCAQWASVRPIQPFPYKSSRRSPDRILLGRSVPARLLRSRLKWLGPARNLPGRGRQFGKRTCKPNSVVCGHSSRRRVAADVHQRPTRRFRPVHGAALRRRAGTERAPCSGHAHPSLFGLAPCGVYPAPGVTAGAVRSYRTISPLPQRWSFHNGERSRQAGPTRVLRFQGGPPERGVAGAVCFLWHWPSVSFAAHIPDVIRHTALRSSDFPPPADIACAKPPAATARSSCQGLVYRESGSCTGYAWKALNSPSF